MKEDDKWETALKTKHGLKEITSHSFWFNQCI